MRLTTHSLKKQLYAQSHQADDQGLPLGVGLLLAFLAGAMFFLALAPYGIWGIALLSPAILYALLIRSVSSWRAFWLGEMYGMGLWCVGAFWLYTSIHTYGNTPTYLAMVMIVIVGAVMGLFHGLLAVVFQRFVGKQPLSFAALWVAQEWLKTWVFTGFPWLFVGYAFTAQSWLNRLAPVFGVLAISFVAVLLSATLVEVLRKRYQFILPTGLFLLLPVALWWVDPQWTNPKNTKSLNVSLIQGNIPQDLKWLTSYQLKTLEIYASLTRDEWHQDVIVWPEASIPMFQTQAWPFINQIVMMANKQNTAWITGIPYQDVAAYNPKTDKYTPFYNSVIALGADSQGLYKKQNLVPVGEYIPFEGAIDWALPKLMNGQMSFSAGEKNQSPLQVKNHQIGVAICYEVAYPDTTRQNAKQTDFLLTVSNDAWFGTTAGPLQHLQMVQMRALETGRWFLRATNTGVTAIIDHQGKIVTKIPQFERGVLRGQVEARTGITPFMQWGSYPILGLCGVLMILSWFGKRLQSTARKTNKTLKKRVR